jgi:hypothetical protein
MVMGIRNRVEGRVIKLQQPLPAGAEVTVLRVGRVTINNQEQDVEFDSTRDDLDDEDRAAQHTCLLRGLQEIEGSPTDAISIEQVWLDRVAARAARRHCGGTS